MSGAVLENIAPMLAVANAITAPSIALVTIALFGDALMNDGSL